MTQSPNARTQPKPSWVREERSEEPRTITKPDIEPPGTLPTKLVVRDRTAGSGPAAKPDDELTVEYFSVDKSGRVAFSSWDESLPLQLSFELGSGAYIPGLEEGVKGMRVGGRRELLIPASQTDGLGPLFYVIDLLEIDRDGRCWAAQAISQAEVAHAQAARADCQARARVG